MWEIKQEKNVLSITLNERTVKLDVNSGKFYSEKTGNLIKSVPKGIKEMLGGIAEKIAFERNGQLYVSPWSCKSLKKEEYDTLPQDCGGFIQAILTNNSKNNILLCPVITILQLETLNLIDRLLKVGYPLRLLVKHNFSFGQNLRGYGEQVVKNKRLRDYLIKNDDPICCKAIKEFEFEEYLSTLKQNLSPENLSIIRNLKDSQMPKNYIEWCIKNLLNIPWFNAISQLECHVSTLAIRPGDIANILVEYYKNCACLGRDWCAKDWFTDVCRVKTLAYNKYCAEKEKFFSKHVDPKLLNFSHGNYTIVCPAKGQDLIEEGQKMHHCVGSYVHHVEKGDCAIVFVRHKDHPEIPYITCQIKGDGQIGQYYLAYDKTISSAEDKEFKREYQKYLYSVQESIKQMLLS